MSELALVLKRLRENKEDGRGTYLRYRQRQVLALYNAVLNNEEQFIQALQEDVGRSRFEATLEVALVLKNLKLQFEGSDFQASLTRAKTLRKGGTIPVPYGSALIIGHWTAPLDTIFCPLGAAIVAGNVALTVFPYNAKKLHKLYEEHVSSTIDSAAYPAVLSSENNLHDLMKHPFDVYCAVGDDVETKRDIPQAASKNNAPYQLLPKPGQNVCIVSKTTPKSDLARVARLIVRAKFCAFSGQSLGSPSFITAHEEVHDELVKQLTAAAKEFSAANSDFSVPKYPPPTSFSQLTDGRSKVVFNSVQGSTKTSAQIIIENVPSTSEALERSVKSPAILVVPYTSTEEAINIVSPKLGHVLNIFANTEETDYFAAELRPTLLTSNDIPLDLLIGVCPAPERKDVRWDSGHFERLVHVHEKKTDTSDIMPPFASWQLEKMRNAILPGTVQKLSLNLKKHSNIIRRVFFLQGLFLSLSVVLGSVLLTTGFGGLRVYRYFFK